MKAIAAVLVVALIWLSGLLAFGARVQQQTPPRAPERAEGVVVLTGAGSNARIAAAMGLLEDGFGGRLLVSGVDRKATREDIRNVSRAVRRLYDCCVDLGFTAADTVGNARETASWARAMRFRSLIVVTADYHMPRAMLELRRHMPDVKLIAAPVVTDRLQDMRLWSDLPLLKTLGQEYAKFLVAYVRASLTRPAALDQITANANRRRAS
jgi:uncharacterized SAM-binding protein YcdF (DUF218 family)